MEMIWLCLCSLMCANLPCLVNLAHNRLFLSLMCVNINLCVFDSLSTIRHEREISLVHTHTHTHEDFRCKSFEVPSEIFSCSCAYVQLFHFNANENNLFIAIKVKLLNLQILLEPDKNVHFRRNFKWHLEAFASELFIYITLQQYAQRRNTPTLKFTNPLNYK